MNIQKNKLLSTTVLAMILTATMLIASLPAVNAVTYPNRKTEAYLSVNPHVLGLGQEMTVNLWVFPPPSAPNLNLWPSGYKDITVTFTRPDGSKDTFMPLDGSGHGLVPGQTEQIGAIWFLYTPNQIGTWTVQFSMPQQLFESGGDTVIYEAVTSTTTTFTVQQNPVQIGFPPVSLPSGYWERPISANNREWYQIGGDWLQSGYDNQGTRFNPYSKAPNTGHILWKTEVAAGGIVGGLWGSLSYEAGGGTPPVIMAGKVFYNMPGGVFQCLDLRNGQLLYQASGSITLGIHYISETRDPVRQTPETKSSSPIPYLWELGSSQWKRYNPLNGALVQTISSVPPVFGGAGELGVQISGRFTSYWSEGDTIVYIIRQAGWNTTKLNRLAINELIKWDLNKVTGNNWITGIVWNVSISFPDEPGPGDAIGRASLYIWENVGAVCTAAGGENRIFAFDLNTGARLWNITTDFINEAVGNLQNGAMYNWDTVTRTIHAFDIKTGTKLWVSDPIGEYPWGVQSIGRMVAYGNLYWLAFDGHMYAIDTASGKINWKSDYTGDTTETPFGTWAFYAGSLVSDGKVYAGTSEHTPTQPRMRGNMLICMDAFTGKFIWNVSGAIAANAIADGYLLGANEYDGLMYCFGKGKTATTVSVSQNPVAKGASTVIQGTVMDMSPAQPNTPAISDESMSSWMDYLHMQKPLTAATGVPVKLSAVKSDGSTIDIGTVTSDMGGLFKKMWTPPTEGEYTIIAQFDGSESYWSSYAETALGVTAASASPLPTSTTTAPPPGSDTATMTLYIGIAAVVIVIVVVAAALLIKRRK